MERACGWSVLLRRATWAPHVHRAGSKRASREPRESFRQAPWWWATYLAPGRVRDGCGCCATPVTRGVARGSRPCRANVLALAARGAVH
eukprot:6503446-Prymnesium_polylepis.1